VVTGAGQGIGRGIAELYAREGAHVAVVDIQAQAADEVVEGIQKSGGSAMAVACDVSSRAEVTRAHEQVTERLGTVSILVNNAGITRPAMLWNMTDEDWDAVLATHLYGSFLWLQAVTPGMRDAGSGRVIFSTSAAGILGSIGQINYSAAKAGLLGMTRSAAKELARYGILVNAIAPAAATPMTEKIRTDDRFRESYLEEIPLRRWAEPEEVARTYLFLASSDSSYMTGQVLSVDGGRTTVR
jgi:3-oxoacyl-[acyl-carrier protein] reductase